MNRHIKRTPACFMTDADLSIALAWFGEEIDRFEAAPIEDRACGGSPGEWLYERFEELEIEICERASVARLLQAREEAQ